MAARVSPRFTFESKFQDGSPRRFAGTWRPPFEELYARYRNQGGWLDYHLPGKRDLWMRGEWDVPIYHLELDET